MIKRSGEDGLSTETIADRTGMSRRSARYYTEQLNKQGLLFMKHKGWQRFWVAKEI
jgi:response regulator of citrate/malate metabolism